MNLYLNRFGSIPDQGTFGELLVEDLKLKTIEREWLNNKSFVSCIPSGKYKLVPHERPNGELVYAVVNEKLGIYQWPNSKAVRDLILIHAANHQDQLAGCIAPGDRHGGLSGRFSVYNSAVAMTNLRKVLGDEEHTLTIRWRQI